MKKYYRCGHCSTIQSNEKYQNCPQESKCDSPVCPKCKTYCFKCKKYCDECYTQCKCGQYCEKNKKCACMSTAEYHDRFAIDKDLRVCGRVIVNDIVDKVPKETTVYTSNIIDNHIINDNNYVLVDTVVHPPCDHNCSRPENNHSVFLGRNIANQTQKGHVLAEFAGISSNSNNINGSLKFIAKENFCADKKGTKANIEINNQAVASFQELNNVANMGTATITLSIYYNNPPSGVFKEGTIALIKTKSMYSLVIYNGCDWVKL